MTDEPEGDSSPTEASGKMMKKADVATQLSTLHAFVEEQLSEWEGWKDFSSKFSDIVLKQVLGSPADDIEVVPLLRCQLQAFIDFILSLRWHYTKDPSDVFKVPMSVIELMENAQAIQNEKKVQEECMANQIAELKQILKTEVMTFPDMNNLVQITSESSPMTKEFVAPSNGFITGNVRLGDGKNDCCLSVNGRSFGCIGAMTGASGHIPFFFPIHKDDTFMVTGGARHGFWFSPCRGIDQNS